jgi:hypothetical protein
MIKWLKEVDWMIFGFSCIIMACTIGIASFMAMFIYTIIKWVA